MVLHITKCCSEKKVNIVNNKAVVSAVVERRGFKKSITENISTVRISLKKYLVQGGSGPL